MSSVLSLIYFFLPVTTQHRMASAVGGRGLWKWGYLKKGFGQTTQLLVSSLKPTATCLLCFCSSPGILNFLGQSHLVLGKLDLGTALGFERRTAYFVSQQQGEREKQQFSLVATNSIANKQAIKEFRQHF